MTIQPTADERQKRDDGPDFTEAKAAWKKLLGFVEQIREFENSSAEVDHQIPDEEKKGEP